MFVGRDGTFYAEDPREDVAELPEELESLKIHKCYPVEIWSRRPSQEGAKFLGEEVFDSRPTNEQLYWCFAKYGDCILRIKEERYLGTSGLARFDPDEIDLSKV